MDVIYNLIILKRQCKYIKSKLIYLICFDSDFERLIIALSLNNENLYQ